MGDSLKTVIVIEQIDKDRSIDLIGVARSMEAAIKMLQEYNGGYELLETEDVQDSGIEFVFKIRAAESPLGDNEYTVVFKSFQIDCV